MPDSTKFGKPLKPPRDVSKLANQHQQSEQTGKVAADERMASAIRVAHWHSPRQQ